MNFLIKEIRSIINAYTERDRFLTGFGIVLIVLMFLKIQFFPSGFFNFGKHAVYTEGLVSSIGIQNLNPLFVEYNEADREVSRLLFSGLMKYDPESGDIVSDMATLVVNEEKTEYVLSLKDGLHWHDGEVLNADDVYFTFHDLIQDDYFQNEILKSNFDGVVVEKIDDKTIKFTLDKPNVYFLTNLTVGIVPEHILSDTDASDLLTDDFNKYPIGSGPYMLTEPVEKFLDGRWQVTLKRFDDYYGEQSEIEFFRFIVFQNFDNLLQDLNALNGVVKVPGENILDFKEQERFDLIPYYLPQYLGIFMNMDSKILNDDRYVRLALQKAIDKDEIIGDRKDLLHIDTPLLTLNQDEWVYQSSIEQAQGALKEAGYLYAEEDTNNVGLRYKDGEALELKMIARAFEEGTQQMNDMYDLVDYLVAQWQEIGVAVDVEYLDSYMFNETLSSRQYDLALVGHNLGYNFDTYSYWHSSQANPRGQNFSNYGKFQVDTLIEAARSTFDKEEATAISSEIAAQIQEDIPAIFLYRPVYYYANDKKIEGLNLYNVVFPADRFSAISQWKFL